jgi:hypothetical protein
MGAAACGSGDFDLNNYLWQAILRAESPGWIAAEIAHRSMRLVGLVYFTSSEFLWDYWILFSEALSFCRNKNHFYLVFLPLLLESRNHLCFEAYIAHEIEWHLRSFAVWANCWVITKETSCWNYDSTKSACRPSCLSSHRSLQTSSRSLTHTIFASCPERKAHNAILDTFKSISNTFLRGSETFPPVHPTLFQYTHSHTYIKPHFQ